MTLSEAIKEYTLTKVRIDQVRTDPSNPNKMTIQQMLALEKSMHQFGYLTPIIVDADTMMIADGEHRYQVYKELGYEEIPAYVIRFDNDAQRRMLRQVMNKLHGIHDREMDAIDIMDIIVDQQNTLLELADLIATPKIQLEQLISPILYRQEESQQQEQHVHHWVCQGCGAARRESEH
jgi:hypothetical protein